MDEDTKKKIDSIPLEYKKTKEFFHCKYCTEQFLGSDLHQVMTPKEYGLYEVGSYEFTYPDGNKAMIAVVWCKRCGRNVWDSRNYTKMY
jgi:formylmethanofuran dehydrogenase subunit E